MFSTYLVKKRGTYNALNLINFMAIILAPFANTHLSVIDNGGGTAGQQELLEKIKKQNDSQFEEFKKTLKGAVTKEDFESIGKKLEESNELTSKQYKELNEILVKHGEWITLQKSNLNAEKDLMPSDAIVNVFKAAGINSYADMVANKSKLKDGVEIKANITTALYSGTVSRTQEVSPVRFAPTRPLAFIGKLGGGLVQNAKSILMWTVGSYTSNAGYAGEGVNGVTEDSASAIEKTRLMAKISAKNYMTAETFEDLPQFAQRLQDQLSTNAMVFLDSEILKGNGADGGANTQHIYGIIGQGSTAFDSSLVFPVEKANVADLADSAATQAEIAFHKVDSVWMSPKLANKLRRTKTTTGEYVINKLMTGEEVMGGLTVIRTSAFETDNEMLVANAAAIQLWFKRNMVLKVGQFGSTDVETDRFTAILFTRAQVLVEDEDKKGVIYIEDVDAALTLITA